MSHLDDRLSALVDGELSHDDRDRALAHVATCNDCRAALEVERNTKRLLSQVPAPVPPPDLAERLLALPGSMEPARPSRRRRRRLRRTTASAASRSQAHPSSGRPTQRAAGRTGATRRSVRRGARLGGGFMGAAAMAFGASFALGAAPEPAGTPVLPPVSTFSVEHARTGAGLPFGSPAMSAVETSDAPGEVAETLGGPYGGLERVTPSVPAVLAPGSDDLSLVTPGPRRWGQDPGPSRGSTTPWITSVTAPGQ